MIDKISVEITVKNRKRASDVQRLLGRILGFGRRPSPFYSEVAKGKRYSLLFPGCEISVKVKDKSVEGLK